MFPLAHSLGCIYAPLEDGNVENGTGNAKQNIGSAHREQTPLFGDMLMDHGMWIHFGMPRKGAGPIKSADAITNSPPNIMMEVQRWLR